MTDEELCDKAEKKGYLAKPAHYCDHSGCGNEADWVDDEGDVMCTRHAAESLRNIGFMEEEQ